MPRFEQYKYKFLGVFGDKKNKKIGRRKAAPGWYSKNLGYRQIGGAPSLYR